MESKALEGLREISSSLTNDYMGRWKEQGGKVVGYFYSYVPDEMLVGAGIMPYRIRGLGSTTTMVSDKYLTESNCPASRYTMDAIMSGGMDFLDAIVGTNICDHVRRVYENINLYGDIPCISFVFVPRVTGEHHTATYASFLEKLRGNIEEHFGVKVSDPDIEEGIRTCNRVRALQRRLYDTMRADNPPLSGADVHAVMIAAECMPKQDYEALLEQLLDDVAGEEGDGTPASRFLLSVGELDDLRFVETVESQGGKVVTDSMLYGTLACCSDVKEGTANPIAALAQRYFGDDPALCPRIIGGNQGRFEYVARLVKDMRVDGVILCSMPFCEQWEFEQRDLGSFLRRNGIPCLSITNDYIQMDSGQIKTRVQAFQETMKGARLQ